MPAQGMICCRTVPQAEQLHIIACTATKRVGFLLDCILPFTLV